MEGKGQMRPRGGCFLFIWHLSLSSLFSGCILSHEIQWNYGNFWIVNVSSLLADLHLVRRRYLSEKVSWQGVSQKKSESLAVDCFCFIQTTCIIDE